MATARGVVGLSPRRRPRDQGARQGHRCHLRTTGNPAHWLHPLAVKKLWFWSFSDECRSTTDFHRRHSPREGHRLFCTIVVSASTFRCGKYFFGRQELLIPRIPEKTWSSFKVIMKSPKAGLFDVACGREQKRKSKPLGHREFVRWSVWNSISGNPVLTPMPNHCLIWTSTIHCSCWRFNFLLFSAGGGPVTPPITVTRRECAFLLQQ